MLSLVSVMALSAAADNEDIADDNANVVCTQLENYYHEIAPYRAIIPTQREHQLNLLSRRLKMFETRFTTYTTNYQDIIDQSQEASTQMENVETLLHELLMSIDAQIANLQKINALYKAEKYIPQQIATYKKMHHKAMEYMMVKQMGPKLEKLKAEEAVLKSDIDAIFNDARAAVEINPELKQRLAPVEECYYLICTYSGEIQEAAYKPLIARIKDYLLSLAAVAIIIMFFNMLVSKFKAYKAAKKAALEAKKALEKQQQYPQI